jgi:hypothetical protein
MCAALALALLVGIGAPSCRAFPKHKNAALHSEKIEWTWTDRSDTIDPKLPNVLLVGDSITRGYFPDVAKAMAGKANVYLFATSCSSGDSRLNAYLHLYFEDAPAFSVIHFNNGLHGSEYTEAQYAAGLPGLIHEFKKDSPGSRLIWATITPIRKDNPKGPTNARIDARNAAALAVMKQDGIPVDDQHALMLDHPDLHLDDVHFNDKGTAVQGVQAVASIEAAMSAAP